MTLRANMERVRRAVRTTDLTTLTDEEIDRRIVALEAERRAAGQVPGAEELTLDARIAALQGSQ